MISKKLILEFQGIMKSKYQVELNLNEATLIGNDLVEYFNTLAKIDFEEKKSRSLQK